MKKYWIGLFFAGFLAAGCNSGDNQNQQPQNEGQQTEEKSELVRGNDINVPSLDANKDNKLYQCPMDEHFHVISDSSGTCPVCKMDLKEYSVEQAEKNFKNRKPQS